MNSRRELDRIGEVAAAARAVSPVAPADRDWTAEDIRFVTAVLDVDDTPTLRRLAGACLDEARKEVGKIAAELGHPDGFDPYVAGLVYARAGCATSFASMEQKMKLAAEVGALEREQDRLRQLLLAAKRIIDAHEKESQ